MNGNIKYLHNLAKRYVNDTFPAFTWFRMEFGDSTAGLLLQRALFLCPIQQNIAVTLSRSTDKSSNRYSNNPVKLLPTSLGVCHWAKQIANVKNMVEMHHIFSNSYNYVTCWWQYYYDMNMIIFNYSTLNCIVSWNLSYLIFTSCCHGCHMWSKRGSLVGNTYMMSSSVLWRFVYIGFSLFPVFAFLFCLMSIVTLKNTAV